MPDKRLSSAFTLVEVMVVVLLLGIVMTASSTLLVTGERLFLDTSLKSDVQANVMHSLYRISFELQNSGYDSGNTLQASVLDNAGANGTDILRFSIPLCVCGTSPFDAGGNVRSWGAPLVWGQNGCTTQYPVDSNGKVDICHLPPGHPENAHDLSVSVNAVPAHLAHGDYIGDCDACTPSDYNNKTIEYRVDANGRLLRHVLDAADAVVNAAIMAQNIVTFQVVLDTAVSGKHDSVNVTVGASRSGVGGRTAAVVNNVDVLFRNR